MPAKRSRHTSTDSLFPEADADSSQLPPSPELPKPWAKVLTAEFGKPYFAELMRFVGKERAEYEILPPEPDVYNAFQYTPLDQVRVVILGQDPYPTPGHAHGLCFSVRPGVALPGSLRNIYKELHSDLGIPPAKHGYLAAWAKRGVFLLNTVLTVRAGKPASHAKKGWETFTDAALQAVNELPRPVVFVLWGAHAQKKAGLIDTKRHVILASAHPSPLSASNGFFGSKPFSKANDALAAAGEPTIDWRLPAEPKESS
ncbi:MAG TPA: uracil-DNA glycosylase [Fimbriiglobus sp.]|nr:uracil-DNA glycosylase [Fimbriiglobus sp.]